MGLAMFTKKFQNFMLGRYGFDQLNFALIITAAILSFLDIFINSYVLTFIIIFLLVWETYRAFSKKHYARQRENASFLRIWHPVKKWFATRYTRFKERKLYRYRTCPNCRATLRLPALKGKHTAKCPRCSTEFDVRII